MTRSRSAPKPPSEPDAGTDVFVNGDAGLHAEPGHLIRRAHQLAVSVFHGNHGRQITPVQYGILRALQDTPGIDQVTLAEKVALDTSTTADIATRLESKGWIVRELLARRQRSLYLTPEGESIVKEMRPRVLPMYRQLLAPLTPVEQKELLRLLGKLVQLDIPTPAVPDDRGSNGKAKSKNRV